jgi:hypothetical protein
MHGPSAGYNLIHVKPSITFKVSPKVTLITARVFQWHAIAADAIYSQGMAVVPRHGRGANALERDVWAGSRRLACQFERCARAGSGAKRT